MTYKITYANKEGIYNDLNIPETGKFTDANANEIKEVVNANADKLTDLSEKTNKIKKIEENISDINNKQDLQKNDISNIQQENINLKEKIRLLEKNQIQSVARGESIHANDTAECLAKLDLAGNSKQEIKESKNKLKYPYAEKTVTKNGITFTVNNDGTVNVSGTATDVTLFYYRTNQDSLLLEAGEYKMVGGVSNNLLFRVQKYVNGALVNFEDTGKGATFSLEKDENILACIRVASGATVNAIIKAMILYEPYGSILDEIKNCENNINIVACNKNQFNENEWKQREVESNKNVLKFNGYFERGTGTKTGNPLVLLENPKMDTTYTAQGKFKKTTYYNNLSILYDDFSLIPIGEFSDNYEKSSITFKTSATKKALYIFTDTGTKSSNGYAEESSVQIEEATEATEYVEHKEQRIQFPFVQNQKLMKDDYLAKDGIHHRRKQVVLGHVDRFFEGTVFETKCKYAIYPLSDVEDATNSIDFLCDKIVAENKEFKQYGSYITDKQLVVLTTLDDTLENFNNKINGAILEYNLANEEIEEYTEDQKAVYDQLQNLLIYEDVTNIYCTDDISSKMTLHYNKSLKSLDARIVALENK